MHYKMQLIFFFIILLNRYSECYKERITKCNSEEFVIQDTQIEVDFLTENIKRCTEVSKIILENVALKRIPEFLFQKTLKVKIIRVTNNLIKEIGKRTFKNLNGLQVLNLSKNKIREAIIFQ